MAIVKATGNEEIRASESQSGKGSKREGSEEASGEEDKATLRPSEDPLCTGARPGLPVSGQ